tara:strand:+ start:47 stop:796 length:750 start_codon:yes stop_codon:yes gene_type:complete
MIITAVGRLEYLNLLTQSIDKYTKYSHKIYIVTDVRNEKEEQFFRELQNYYEKYENIFIVESKNKDDDRDGFAPCPIDGRIVGKPSFYKSAAYETGIENSNGKYVCLLDYDVIFLNEWVSYVLPLAEEYFFVSAMWRGDLKIARDQFFIYKREKFDEVGLIPDCSIGDTTGNVTHFAQKNNLPFYICENSSNYGNWSLRDKHILNLEHGEQIFIDDMPFLYHYGRGSAREIELYEKWIKVVSDYLGTNK